MRRHDSGIERSMQAIETNIVVNWTYFSANFLAMQEPVPGPTPWMMAIGLSKVGAILIFELEKCLYIELSLLAGTVREIADD